ncbi:MAG: glycosyltransferase [Ignavibacteria bacterium]|nr:glycosyltransferase [Ignavibacteria bacterium]MBI3766623.1 glycosyltransferase [Ignavibacteriales bacterium]
MVADRKPNVIIYFEGEVTGGVTGVIESYVPSLSDQFSFTLIYRDTPSLHLWANKFETLNVEPQPIAVRNYGDVLGWLDVGNLLRLSRAFRRAQLIHFHLHTVFSCLPAMFLAKVVGVDVLLTTEHYITQVQFLRRRKLVFPLSLLRELKIRSLMLLKRLSLKFLSSIVTVSESNHDYFLSLFGHQLEQKTRTIANGIDVEKFISMDGQKPVPDSIDVKDSNTQIITVVAGLNNQKGHEHLLRAIPSVIEEKNNIVFLFVGDGHLRYSLESLARELGVADHIIFAGNRSDVPQILAASDLFVLPSLFEGMPLSVLEAMAASKAVVATNVDGTAEAVEDGITGFLVPSKNSAALADKIIQLLSDDQLRIEFGKRGRERVCQFYNSEYMARQYSELYQQFLKD